MGKSLTDSPSRHQRRLSRQITIVARVTTMEGNPSPDMRAPLTAPNPAPKRMVAMATTGIGTPERASKPATTAQSENCEPTEISILGVKITSAIPTTTTSVGALEIIIDGSLSHPQHDGAAMARTK